MYLLEKPVVILGIESSCDDTSAAVLIDGKIASNVIANQDIHKDYGGVVPELASRAHQQNILPVVSQALKLANIEKEQLSAIAFTRGPGLLGSLLVGVSFAKSMAMALNIPIIEVNHMEAHVLANFIDNNYNKEKPTFPFLCLTVSGGHSQIVLTKDYLSMQVIGETKDDAAGEAFDKSAKIMGLPYPGGPIIDNLAKNGDPKAFSFPHPKVDGYNYSFSGLKTAFLYFIKNKQKESPTFIETNKEDICASIQSTIVDVLLHKLEKASDDLGIKEIAIAGGVAANSHLREKLSLLEAKLKWNIYIPDFQYCTDNAGMIVMAGYYKYLKKQFTDQSISATARYSI
jgi:N6-L-threonylcarbamoyladenine synthase